MDALIFGTKRHKNEKSMMDLIIDKIHDNTETMKEKQRNKMCCAIILHSQSVFGKCAVQCGDVRNKPAVRWNRTHCLHAT